MLYILVAIFGILGATCRYGISILVPSQGFPMATLIVNLLGCFLLAVVMKYIAHLPRVSPVLITAIGTGFVGSFTTFSTFSVESIHLLENHLYGLALLYIALSLFGGLLASNFGFYCSQKWLSRKESSHVH